MVLKSDVFLKICLHLFPKLVCMALAISSSHDDSDSEELASSSVCSPSSSPSCSLSRSLTSSPSSLLTLLPASHLHLFLGILKTQCWWIGKVGFFIMENMRNSRGSDLGKVLHRKQKAKNNCCAVKRKKGRRMPPPLQSQTLLPPPIWCLHALRPCSPAQHGQPWQRGSRF